MEKERPLDVSVFLRFAACGAACGSTAHAFLIPIDVVKTRMQSEPKRYPDTMSTFSTLVKEEVRVLRACLRRAFARVWHPLQRAVEEENGRESERKRHGERGVGGEREIHIYT